MTVAAPGGRELLLAAAQAALDAARDPADSSRRARLLSPLRAMLLGAGAVTVWRLAARRRRGSLAEALQRRLLDYEERHLGRPGASKG